MPILADYHLHTSFSGDSDELMENMVKKAIQLNLTHICFTEHIDLDFPKEYNLNFEVDLDAYFKEANRLKDLYSDKIKIFHGIELGLMPHLSKRYTDLVNNNAFDFVIGSSHLVNGKDPYYDGFWINLSEKDGYTKYFESIIENVKAFSNFDVYGHIDYIVRYGVNKNTNYSYKKYADILDELLKTIISAKKGIEVNSAGYKYGLNNPNPHYDVLNRYKELGGELITIGSDSHDTTFIADSFTIICERLKSIGFKYYAVYEDRKPIYLKL